MFRFRPVSGVQFQSVTTPSPWKAPSVSGITYDHRATLASGRAEAVDANRAQQPVAVPSPYDRPHPGAPRRLALPVDERAELVHDLLASLKPALAEDPDQVAAAWNREFERRGREVLDSDLTGADWATVRDRLRSELASE